MLDIGEEAILLRFRGVSTEYAEWELPTYPDEVPSSQESQLGDCSAM